MQRGDPGPDRTDEILGRFLEEMIHVATDAESLNFIEYGQNLLARVPKASSGQAFDDQLGFVPSRFLHQGGERVDASLKPQGTVFVGDRFEAGMKHQLLGAEIVAQRHHRADFIYGVCSLNGVQMGDVDVPAVRDVDRPDLNAGCPRPFSDLSRLLSQVVQIFFGSDSIEPDFNAVETRLLKLIESLWGYVRQSAR
jgi:hypothetical protein